MADKFDQEDPFKKYGGNQIDQEDPFKKYGGVSIEEPSKKKVGSGIGGKVGSSVGRLDVGAGITEIDDKGKPVGGALSRVSGITTPEQAKISRVNKAFGKIESFAGSREDFEEIYKQAPQEFDNIAKQVAPNVNKGEIDKFYTTEAAQKDAYVDRVFQSYNQQKTKAQLESARRYRPVIESQFSTATIPLSNYTGKQYQLPQSEAQVSEILSDLNNEKEKLKTELTTNWNLSEVQTKAKELSKIEAAIRQNLTYQVGRMALERLSQNNPNVTSKDIGKEIFRVLHPDEYDLYEKVGGDKPVSFTVGTQRDTPVEADALNEQMVKLGNEIKRMYGNETAIQDADIEEQTAKRKYTFQRQAQVKQKIAAILHERGLSPDKATEELKDKVVNKYLPDEDKEIWYNNNKAYNNTKLPSTGLGYSFKNDFNSFVKDAVSSTFGVLLPNRQKARAAQVLAESSESKLLGEDPQYKARLGQLKAKEEQIGLSDKEKEEKESLETYTNIRSKWEKRFDLAGTGLGTIMAMGTVSAFTGGLLNARNIPTAIKSLIAPSQASMRGRLATSVLTFYESNARNALKEYPNDKDWFKRGLKAGLDTAVDSLTEMLFPEEKILSGIGKREVAKMVSNLTAKNLNATLNSNIFKDIARAMIGGSKRLVAVPLQEGAEELIAATLKEAYDGAINPDPDRQALDIKQMIEIGENTLWSSGLLGVPKALFGGKSNKVPLNALWDSVSTQDGYITQKMTIERLKRDGELTEAEAKDRLDNLELGRNEYIKNPILSGDMGGLDAGQKQNYFARILNEAILKKQADAVTDPNLKKQYEQQIKESEAIREKIYKGEIKVTPENEELTKQEFEKKEKEQVKIDQDRVLGDEEVVVSQSDEELLTTLQELAQEGVKDQDLQFFVDQAANAPNQFIETYGEQVTQELLDKATTEQIQKGLEDARKFENNPNVSLLEKELERRKTTIADFVAPQEQFEDIITNQEYNEFIDKGIVSDETLNNIAEKVKNQQQLSQRELEIFTDKTAEINKIISEPAQETTPVSEPTTPPTTQAKELADKSVGKYEKKAREIAEKIQKSELPNWLKADLPDGTKKAGASYDQLKKALADAVIEMGKLLDKGVEYSQAIKQAVKDLVSLQGEENRDTIEKGFEKYYTDQTQQQPPPPQTPKQEPKEVGIKHKETEAIRQRYGLPEYERVGGKTNAELEAEADRLISEGYDIEKLIKKIEDGTPPTGVENYILTKYIGNLEAKFAKDKSDETLKELKRLLDATDRIGSLQSEAFRTRKAMSPADDSLASFFIKEMDSLGVDELTQEQKNTITKEYEEIKATNDALQKKIVELERQMAEMEAKQKVSNEAKRVVRGRKTKQQFNEERKKIIGNIREKLRKAKGETQATVVPYLKELIVIAPDVAKLVKNLVEEGVTNLADIVDNIHEYLKEEIDGIQKKDVVDLIAGVYDEKKPTRNELAKKIVDLKREAKLVSELDKLLLGEEVKSEKKKIQTNKRIKELKDQIRDIKNLEKDIERQKELSQKLLSLPSKTKKEKTPLEIRKDNILKEINKIEQSIKNGDFSKPLPKKKIKLDKEGQQLRDKLIKLKQQRDARILLNQRINETKKQRGLRLFAEVLNIPRTLMTIGDFSGLLRQGIFGISHPSMMANASKQMFKTAFSQKEYDRWFADLKDDPRYYAMKESKLSIADSLSHDLSEREEVFMSTLAEKIPIVGQTLTIKGKKVIPGLNIVKGSERSYTALLNKMRVDLFNYFADSMESRGLTVENAPKQYKAMAEYINNATGRSDFGKHLNRIAPILNSVFFSPRLIASRVNMLTYFMQPRFWKTLPKEARIDYFRSWASLLSIGLTILALAQAGGADVEDDPRSSDFGKIKSGDTRWDIWGGAQPYIRVFAQVLSGKRKSTNSGEIYELTGDDAFGETRAGVVSDFFRGKLAPVPASMVDVLSGRTTTGDKIVYEFETDGVKEVAIDNYIMERLLPMTITGTREAIKERGASAILTVGVPSVFGVGTQTYGKPVKEVRDEVEYEGVKIKLTKEQYLEYRDLANKYINQNVEKLKSLKEYQQIEDRDERLGIERSVKNYSVKKAEQEIIDKYEATFKDTEELKDKAKEKKEKREDILEQIKD